MTGSQYSTISTHCAADWRWHCCTVR